MPRSLVSPRRHPHQVRSIHDLPQLPLSAGPSARGLERGEAGSGRATRGPADRGEGDGPGVGAAVSLMNQPHTLLLPETTVGEIVPPIKASANLLRHAPQRRQP